MGTLLMVDHPMWTERGADRENTYLFAPSLRALPAGFPLVMATLPVADWNGEFLKAVDQIEVIAGVRAYAALMMIDPFTLWEDVLDALKQKGFSGVINFPPAALMEPNAQPTSEGHASQTELERMRWFAENGLKVALTVAALEAGRSVDNLFKDKPDLMLYAPPSDLQNAVASVAKLVTAQPLSGIPTWSISNAGPS